jgi:hypothetical protein
LIEIWGETDGGDTDDNFKIVVTMSGGKNKVLKTNKNFHILDTSTDLKEFKTKDKKQSNSSII